MTEPVDRTYDMLQRIGEFLKKLTPEKYEALLSGEAKLEVLPKGARITGAAPAKAAAPVELPVPANLIAADLAKFTDRASAVQYLKDLKLSKPQTVLLAKELGVAFKASATAAAVQGLVVDYTVGSRLRSDAILNSR
ncbi:ABC-type uncharacterized transport system auxiliary subunit [Allocatelliglobosispora scoriae]|uniref:ABC-type uncharacterized transport system auxiliary subunit n=1 Tax=Allocatelliglobosispora scoriae TaxID=643052 RepID=A0A841BK73_9ACTN|nr:hypothetical protein [Allocatelliglobosispora scoriae]MBB5867579.1 ABC-type uncharacterized transport system auxiliary subunit [Allocatelliglobosispora scoriae]